MFEARFDRRTFLGFSALAAGTFTLSAAAETQLGAPVKATSGDRRREPDWEERLTVTVGKGGDFEGATERAIQAAVDYCVRLGGGTVKILPGTYTCRNSIFLRSGMRITGSGAETILLKCPSVSTTLAKDTDWFDQEITLANAEGFNVGDGICMRTKNPHTGGMDVFKRTLIARSGNRFKLDSAPRQNFWMDQTPEITTLFPVITAEFQTGITIENLSIDGNKDNNGHLDGNYAGCLWFQDCAGMTFRNVEAHHYNGDGMSWQICHDVTVEDCHSHDNADLGLHPGSGSQRPVMRNNRIERNNIGIFFCWGVREGIAEDNTITGNRGEGVSIGHRDHYNIVRNNTIEDSGNVGVLFRPERGEGFTGTGNLIEKNRIRNSGGDGGVAVDILGVTEGNTIQHNHLEETRGPAQRIGIRIGAEAGENLLAENTIEGMATKLVDLRTQ